MHPVANTARLIGWPARYTWGRGGQRAGEWPACPVGPRTAPWRWTYDRLAGGQQPWPKGDMSINQSRKLVKMFLLQLLLLELFITRSIQEKQWRTPITWNQSHDTNRMTLIAWHQSHDTLTLYFFQNCLGIVSILHVCKPQSTSMSPVYGSDVEPEPGSSSNSI